MVLSDLQPGIILIFLFDTTSTIASSFFPTILDLINMKEFLECA